MERYSPGSWSVSRIGLGAMQLPGPGVFGPPRDCDEALAVLRRALELGVAHIDIARYYGPDVANELIKTALCPYPDHLALVSKVGALLIAGTCSIRHLDKTWRLPTSSEPTRHAARPRPPEPSGVAPGSLLFECVFEY